MKPLLQTGDIPKGMPQFRSRRMLTFQECVRDAQIFRRTDKSRPEIFLLSFGCART